jgi:hypothetical protein
MIEVRALESFEHSGTRRPGDRFKVSPNQARRLSDKGLVELVRGRGNPRKAAGTPSSASPAAQACIPTTSNESDAGAKKRRGRRKARAAS